MKSHSPPGASSQIILPQMCINSSDRPTVHKCFFYTPPCCCSKKTEHTYITYARSHPPHTLYLLVVGVCCFVLFIYLFIFCLFGHLPISAPPSFSALSFFFFLIGLIPRSLACPIIFWNIQGNVSSCCHSNYCNIQHGS